MVKRIICIAAILYLVAIPLTVRAQNEGRPPKRGESSRSGTAERDRLSQDRETRGIDARRETSAEERVRIGRERNSNNNEAKADIVRSDVDRTRNEADRNIEPRIEYGNLRWGWVHIEARHISGEHPTKGAGDLFTLGATKQQLEDAARSIVRNGERISDRFRRIQVFEKQIEVNGKADLVRVVVDSQTNNRVITIFPVRSK